MRFFNTSCAVVIGCAVLTLAACGGGGGGSSAEPATVPPVTPTPSAPNPPPPVPAPAPVQQLQWSVTGSLQTARGNHTATLLPDGKVLVAGLKTSNVEVYDPATGVWQAVGHADVGPYGRIRASLLPNGKVLIDSQLYDPGSNTTVSVSTPFRAGMYDYADVLLPNGKLLRTGGYVGDNTNTDAAHLFDPTTRAWTTAASMLVTRRWHTATLLPNGKVLVAGGSAGNAEIYDPASNTWTVAAKSPVKFWTASATLLPNGKVLFVPELAHNFDETERNASIYDPITDSWTLAGVTATDRESHTATLLPNGSVLVAGGGRYARSTGLTTGTNVAELYDPATNTWSLAPALILGPRAGHTATLLRNGSVLVVGGAEVYGFSQATRPESALYGPL